MQVRAHGPAFDTELSGQFVDRLTAQIVVHQRVDRGRVEPSLRSSPLGKRYGWGIHHDADGRIALVPLGSDEYRALAADPHVTQLTAMRSARA